ncbi:hypothetical protein Salat_2809300 [Sesamum alatum]|uniref:Uncharacterized protein n=1 Tax=Sesamum alatum TaxID=300844 RepID=A0AAE1XL30_9LAMI|nr:hypothetical protein Salat_2809300 [Sesamum alatum]
MSNSYHPFLNPNSNFDEQRWIIQIRQALDEDNLEQESDDVPVSIFTVPNTLMLASPESYVPQQLALGPYHHHRAELYEMERYKLSAARRFQKHLPGLKFHNLVHHFTKLELRFRACYHKFLNFNGETLAWMMAVDSCFLLEFLHHMVVLEEERAMSRVSSRMSHLIDITGRKSGHNTILRDMLMLENQIPLFALKQTLDFKLGSSDETDDVLCAMLIGFCKEVLPFKMVQELPDVDQVHKCAHLLDLLYNLILPNVGESVSEIASEAEKDDVNRIHETINFPNVVSKLRAGGLMSLIKRLLVSRIAKFLLRLPWKIVSNLPGMILVKQFEYLCFSQEKGEKNELENRNSCSDQCNYRPPLMEEIAIPSVTELSKAGVKFSVTNSGILEINFDVKTATFYLPMISLDVNTEVVLRNLVAYEACNTSGPLVFARYTELMNGIIDTEEDARVLREKGIVLNHLKSDQDVADLWNGMSKSVRLTKVPFLDKVIEDVNCYYRGRFKVRIGKFLKRHVFGSWQSMTLLAAVLLLFFMSLQAFCSLFGCARIFLHRRKMN